MQLTYKSVESFTGHPNDKESAKSFYREPTSAIFKEKVLFRLFFFESVILISAGHPKNRVLLFQKLFLSLSELPSIGTKDF
jgi:hypothetical protein